MLRPNEKMYIGSTLISINVMYYSHFTVFLSFYYVCSYILEDYSNYRAINVGKEGGLKIHSQWRVEQKLLIQSRQKLKFHIFSLALVYLQTNKHLYKHLSQILKQTKQEECDLSHIQLGPNSAHHLFPSSGMDGKQLPLCALVLSLVKE